MTVTEDVKKVFDSLADQEVPTFIADPIMKLISVETAPRIKEVRDAVVGEDRSLTERKIYQYFRDEMGWDKEKFTEWRGDKSIVECVAEMPKEIASKYQADLEELKGKTGDELKAKLEEQYTAQIQKVTGDFSELQNRYKTLQSEFQDKSKEYEGKLLEKDRRHWYMGQVSRLSFKGTAKDDPEYRNYRLEQAYQKINEKAAIQKDETGEWVAYDPTATSGLVFLQNEDKTSHLTPKDLILAELSNIIDETGGQGGGGGNGDPKKPIRRPKAKTQADRYTFGSSTYGT